MVSNCIKVLFKEWEVRVIYSNWQGFKCSRTLRNRKNYNYQLTYVTIKRHWGIILLTLIILKVLNVEKTTKLLWSTTSYKTSAGNSELKNYSARARTNR